jgi:probable rRNA maturation factor
LLLGDVVLGYETIAKEAKRHGKTLADHMCHLTVHGVLHLAGFDHDTDKAAEKMRGIEIDVLAAAGISNPYTNWLDGPE